VKVKPAAPATATLVSATFLLIWAGGKIESCVNGPYPIPIKI